eukprot:COSAG03_NODE_21429_length_304_cov_0.760976_1_plen_50_part_01
MDLQPSLVHSLCCSPQQSEYKSRQSPLFLLACSLKGKWSTDFPRFQQRSR